MVLIFLLFGYQKWFEYEAQGLVPFIDNGPLTSWMYPVFGVHGATHFLGVSEWLTAALLLWGFWNPKAGIQTPYSGDMIRYVIYNNLSTIQLQPTGHPELAKSLSTLTGMSSITCYQ